MQASAPNEAKAPSELYELRLYVAGQYQIEIIDLLQNPQLVRRSDISYSNPGPQAAGTGEEDYRGLIQYGARSVGLDLRPIKH